MRNAGWEAELEDALRGVAGGLIFGVPLLYTMEVWWLGETAPPEQALAVLALTFVPVFLLVASAGFRQRPELRSVDVFLDVVIAIGLGLATVAIVLVVLQRITVSTPIGTIARSLVFEAAPFAIGAAVATEVFSKPARDPEDDEQRNGRSQSDDRKGARGTVWDLGATAVGAGFIALSIAPTAEVPMLSAGIEIGWLVVVIAFALVVTYGIVFAAGFANQQRRHEQAGVLQRPTTETAAAYLVALAVAAVMLLAFGNLPVADPVAALGHAVVLSLPASIGGAAGRLVV